MVEVRQIAFSKIMSRFFVFFEVFRLAFLFVFDFWVCCFYLGWILGLLSFDLWLLWVSFREWERLAIPTIAENFKIEKIEARFFFAIASTSLMPTPKRDTKSRISQRSGSCTVRDRHHARRPGVESILDIEILLLW